VGAYKSDLGAAHERIADLEREVEYYKNQSEKRLEKIEELTDQLQSARWSVNFFGEVWRVWKFCINWRRFVIALCLILAVATLGVSIAAAIRCDSRRNAEEAEKKAYLRKQCNVICPKGYGIIQLADPGRVWWNERPLLDVRVLSCICSNRKGEIQRRLFENKYAKER
jgi:hypothetical protein